MWIYLLLLFSIVLFLSQILKLKNKDKYAKHDLNIELIRTYHSIKFYKDRLDWSNFDPSDKIPNFINLTYWAKNFKKLEDLGYIKFHNTIFPNNPHAEILKNLPDETVVTITKQLYDFYYEMPEEKWILFKNKDDIFLAEELNKLGLFIENNGSYHNGSYHKGYNSLDYFRFKYRPNYL